MFSPSPCCFSRSFFPLFPLRSPHQDNLHIFLPVNRLTFLTVSVDVFYFFSGFPMVCQRLVGPPLSHVLWYIVSLTEFIAVFNLDKFLWKKLPHLIASRSPPPLLFCQGPRGHQLWYFSPTTTRPLAALPSLLHRLLPPF